MNNYNIKIKKDKQLFYRLIYSLKLIKLKILKIYIKINLINRFIKIFKFFIKVFIFLIKNQIEFFNFILIIKILISL